MNKIQSKGSKIFEGLRHSDLSDAIDHVFTVDQYQSKMGKDENTIVLRFRANGKEPAIDLMEFIEKGYSFILDADMSAGEESDGSYSVFVEVERSPDAPNEILELLNGISRLTDVRKWRFRWYKDSIGKEFNIDNFSSSIPLTPEDYQKLVGDQDSVEISEFFNKGAVDAVFENSKNTITFHRPFSTPLTVKLIALGEYNLLKNVLAGGIQLDESSQNQVLYLNKFLGNYEIHKIEEHFLIRNDERAVIIQKTDW
jgi:hypothetical protein